MMTKFKCSFTSLLIAATSLSAVSLLLETPVANFEKAVKIAREEYVGALLKANQQLVIDLDADLEAAMVAKDLTKANQISERKKTAEAEVERLKNAGVLKYQIISA